MMIAWDISNCPWVVNQSRSRTKFEYIIITNNINEEDTNSILLIIDVLWKTRMFLNSLLKLHEAADDD